MMRHKYPASLSFAVDMASLGWGRGLPVSHHTVTGSPGRRGARAALASAVEAHSGC